MAEPEGDAASFFRKAPFEALKALLGRLSPKDILHMRSICKAWRDMLCNMALLTRLNRDEPPQPLLCFDRAACADYYLHLSDYCVESLDLRSGKPRTVLRFTDNDGYFVDEYHLEGRDDEAPAIEDNFLVDYERMENYGEAMFKPQVTIHGSLDGYLLVSFRRTWYIINPATRHWVPLFDLTAFGLDVVGFYEHRDSGKYRVLCVSRSNPVVHEEAPTYTYHVVEVKPVQRRNIGRPISPPAGRQDHGLRFGVERACISPPIQWKRGNMDLIWPPQQRQGYQMLVFDTRNERFSWKRPPPPVAMTDDQHMRLLEFPDDGNLGLSISRANEARLELWCLEDYQNEVWVLKRRIQLALQQMPALHHGENHPWLPAVVSAEGDVLIEIESRHGLLLFHCDRDGNLLHRFWFDQTRSSHRALPIRHVLKKSLRQHPMFEPSENAVEPPFFRGLCSDDPSCSW